MKKNLPSGLFTIVEIDGDVFIRDPKSGKDYIVKSSDDLEISRINSKAVITRKKQK